MAKLFFTSSPTDRIRAVIEYPPPLQSERMQVVDQFKPHRMLYPPDWLNQVDEEDTQRRTFRSTRTEVHPFPYLSPPISRAI